MKMCFLQLWFKGISHSPSLWSKLLFAGWSLLGRAEAEWAQNSVVKQGAACHQNTCWAPGSFCSTNGEAASEGKEGSSVGMGCAEQNDVLSEQRCIWTAFFLNKPIEGRKGNEREAVCVTKVPHVLKHWSQKLLLSFVAGYSGNGRTAGLGMWLVDSFYRKLECMVLKFKYCLSPKSICLLICSYLWESKSIAQ